MRSTNTFGVRFIIRCPKTRPNEGAIYARVTVNRQRIEIALKRTLDPAKWNGLKGRVEGNKDLARQINPYIEEVRYKLMDAYQDMQVKGRLINAESIKRIFTREEKVRSSVGGLLQYHRLTASSTLRAGTMKNYSSTEKYLFRFLKERHKATDMFLEELNFQFITEFELFLRTTKPLLANSPLTQNGIMKHMERFRKMVTLAVKLQWPDKDPFVHYRLSFKKVERGFLSQTEIDLLAAAEMPNIRLEWCRDIFLFSCYTGRASGIH
ncbi:MAG: site-specific integrase [Chitinophagaceae bacterium]